jgi:putative SOS response-associated peptidase YedK
VLTDGFYEWQKSPETKTKTPMYIRLASGQPFAFAGLWEFWQSADGSELLSCTIITTAPNSLMAPIHNRMPVILPPSVYAAWLEPAEQPPHALAPLLAPYPAELMTAYPVSTVVNNPRFDLPDCVAPLQKLM